MPYFKHDGMRLAYTVFRPRRDGKAAAARSGTSADARVMVLLHGLLLSQRMDLRLAQALAARGNRVVTLDLLGHGKSDRPRDMWRYSMPYFGEQVVGLLDHLEVGEAVVMGTSLGANVSLEVAAAAPERLRAMVIEMPVLDNALPAVAVTFTPLLLALTFGEPVMKLGQSAARAVPSRFVPFWADVGLDALRQDPGPGGAVLQGLFFGRTAPDRTERRTLQTPALVIGHRRDPVHPFSDAGMLAEELPHARLIEADSLLELRLSPERLTGAIGDFIDESWRPRGVTGRGRGRARRAAG